MSSKKRPKTNHSRRKPRGTSGTLHVQAGHSATFIPNEFPDEKAEIEAVVLRRALAAAEAQNIPLYDLLEVPVQNPENDFDFTLHTASGVEYLDLVEFVFPGGYARSPSSYKVGDMAERMFDVIRMKARKYGPARRVVTHILMYSTHWKFLPSDSVIALLTHFAMTRRHGFKTIVVTAPIMDETSIAWRCFPPNNGLGALSKLREEALRANVLHQFDPQAAAPTDDGLGGVFWELPK